MAISMVLGGKRLMASPTRTLTNGPLVFARTILLYTEAHRRGRRRQDSKHRAID